jgi:uncharacterized protein (UPF0332 family)
VNRDVSEEVTAHMQRAQQSLEAARTLRDAGLFDDTASRAYYAAFHAASAVLMSRGSTFKKHGAVIGAVHKQLVHTGTLTVEMGKWLTWLFELRSVGDYGEIIHVEEAQARLALDRAKRLIEVFDKLL